VLIGRDFKNHPFGGRARKNEPADFLSEGNPSPSGGYENLSDERSVPLTHGRRLFVGDFSSRFLRGGVLQTPPWKKVDV
jgi:hypothetical protein